MLLCKANEGHPTKIEGKVLHLLHNSPFVSSLKEETGKKGEELGKAKQKSKCAFSQEAFELRVSLGLWRGKKLGMELEIGALT